MSAGLCSVSLASCVVGRERTGLAGLGWLISTPSGLSSPGRAAGLAYTTGTIGTRHTTSVLQLLTHSIRGKKKSQGQSDPRDGERNCPSGERCGEVTSRGPSQREEWRIEAIFVVRTAAVHRLAAASHISPPDTS